MNTLELHIIKALYFKEKQTIAALSRNIGKSIPLITKGIQQLTKKTLIHASTGESTGGRRAAEYSLSIKSLPNVLSIAMDQKMVYIGLLNLSNSLIKDTIKFPIENKDNLVSQLLEILEKYLFDQKINNLWAIGITIPGFVDATHGVNTSYTDSHPLHHIKYIIEDHLGIPTYIENDSTAIAIAEHYFGKAQHTNDVLVINLNWGVGLGMILNGKFYRGSSGFAGEFSHIPLSNENKLCSCGKRGCLEVEASLLAALENAKKRLLDGQASSLLNTFNQSKKIQINDLITAAHHGDQVAIESFGRIGYMLGKGIATLLHILNPQKVIISGKGAEAGNIMLPQIQSGLLEFSIQRLAQKTSLEISSLKNAQLIGTAAVAIQAASWETANITTSLNAKHKYYDQNLS